MPIVVTGVGVVSALGPNPAAFRRALLDGVNACAMHEFPRLDGSVVKAPAYMAVPAEPEGLIEPKKLRRLFRLARMSAVAARQALKHAELDPASMDPTRLGVCFGTSFGALEPTQKLIDSWLENGEANTSPLQFTNSVHGIMASQIALDINARGVNLTTAQRDICFEAALDTAVQLLDLRRADVILVGGGDELTPLLHEFATRTQAFGGAIPGDGAAVAVLERDDTPRRALARVLGTRTGRHDTGGEDVGQALVKTLGKPQVDLVTNSRDGSPRSARVHAKREKLWGHLQGLACVGHVANFGAYPSSGAQQFVANVLMLSNSEYYRPMAAGEPGPVREAPQTILHDAASISGNHAAYVLAVEPRQ